MAIYNERTVTIATGATQSATGVDLSAFTLLGIYFPSNFDGTTITLQTNTSVNGDYFSVLSAGSAYTITAAASSYAPIENLAIVAGIQFLKITAGTAQTTSDTVFKLALREVQ